MVHDYFGGCKDALRKLIKYLKVCIFQNIKCLSTKYRKGVSVRFGSHVDPTQLGIIL